ncbi:MAG: NTP transferase domain-containing protein [Flavobacteriales bacterium]
MHKKHADLQKPSLGKFARHEVALLGTTCEVISQWAQLLSKALAPAQIVYADANHRPSEASSFLPRWTDNQHARFIELPALSDSIDRHLALSQADLVIVNGNHFEAAHQIIFCDPEKESSLRKRAAQLTDVVAIVTTHTCQTVSDTVKELVPNWAGVPVFNEQNIAQLVSRMRESLMLAPELKALIMAGGKSVRMGKDKTHIDYHGKPQFGHVYALCEQLGIEPFISCRFEQAEYYSEQGYRTVTDRLLDMGPLGGIASAFMTAPDSAWLVLASDVPFLDQEIILELISQRSTYHTATAFQSPFDQFPEPLIAIWEPKAFPMILSFIGLGYSCPRKVLIQTQAKVIVASHPEKLENVNTPDDLEDALEQLKKG